MFQRIKGAIDSRIAEEQARQRASQSSPSRSNSGARKPPSRSASPAVRAARNRQVESKGGDPAQKGPDPKEFEPDFVIDDEDLPSRSVTPRPTPEKSGEVTSGETTVDKALSVNGGQQAKEKGSGDGSPAPAPVVELPTDVRVKLRKLEKLEARYHELLRSYRIAHSRVTAIEHFENTLRENTPLTSINDPGALVEYLNQLNLKGDMVLDELKRLSVERSTFKEKFEEAEKQTREAWDEIAKLREAASSNGDKDGSQPAATHVTVLESTAEPQSANGNLVETEPVVAVVKSPTASIKSYTSSVPGLSLFSPKPKPVGVPQPDPESEEFFSYDSELPRLENELKESQNEISKLHRETTALKGDLAVARESTQNMVKSLEEATRDLNTLREQKTRCELDLEQQRLASEKRIGRLQSDLEAADGKLRQFEIQKSSDDGKTNGELERIRAEIRKAEKEIRELIDEKEKAIANAAQLQLDLDNLHAELSVKNMEQGQNAKRIKTLNGLVEALREQLTKADAEKICTESAVDDGQASTKSLQAQQNSEETATYGASAEAKLLSEPGASKKKNKKKKKTVKASLDQDAEALEESPRLTPNPATTAVVVEAAATTEPSETVAKLEEELNKLRILLGEKDAAIERLHGKLKGEAEMREEIESLREEMVDLGQEHVEAKDRIKNLITEKSDLKKRASELEKELLDLRVSRESDVAGSEQAQKDLAAQFDDLKIKATNLKTDLSVAQQLASSRFKDLTDLRTILQKAQPELTALRTENGELKALKEELSTKITELQKTEVRHNILRSELADLKKVTSTRDAEMRTLGQKLDQESTARQKSEEAASRSNQDMQRSESEKRTLAQSLEKAFNDLAQSRDEVNNMRARVQELENSLSRMERENDGLKEDIELKTAQHASAESLMSSMRDQTAEMAMQTKEARERCESLEEELADAHRLLSERGREGETLRRLLTEVEGRAETRVREMKERMEVALEERDKAEDEANTAGRRKVRELDEVRNSLRDVERSLRRVEQDKEELEAAQRDWKKRREDLEQKAEQSERDAEDVRRAMSELRDALDESERQARELEKQKLELRHSVEDTQLRLDKLQKSNKAMSEELRLIQTPKTRTLDSQGQSPRSSIDSTPSRAKLASPAPKNRTSSSLLDSGPPTPSIDYVYLKNILLQFLEQKDKKHQLQLIPVLGMLLHFDRKDEQKWMAAITTK